MILFISRLLLYSAAVSIVFFHPGIAVHYDTASIVLFFMVIPVTMVLALLASRPPKPENYFLGIKKSSAVTLAFLVLITIIMSGFGASYGRYLLFGTFAYLSTLALFKFRWLSVSALELLAAAGLYLRLINFSRGSEQIAEKSGMLVKLLFFLAIGAIAVHAVVLYLTATYRPGVKRQHRDYIVCAALFLPLLLLFALIIPLDSFEHSIIYNQLYDQARPEYRSIDSDSIHDTNGNIRGNRDLEAERGRQGEPGLSGIPGDQWESGRGDSGDGEARQYAVMVVAAKHDPLYMADRYFDIFDQRDGFITTADNPLNELLYMRLIETWRNPEHNWDRLRIQTPSSVFSINRERVLPYYPLQVSPLIYNVRYRPFNYSWESISSVSISSPQQWLEVRELPAYRHEELKKWLEIPLAASIKDDFQAFLDTHVDPEDSPGQRIIAILQSFSSYQYELGFDDKTSPDHMHDFLFSTRSGDCTEFSNTAAILGRLSGIPSRVVTGYLASTQLQTRSHLYGLYHLRQQMPPLREFPVEDLLLVTTAHRHSWTQFYLRDYGWVDFEATDFAIPPPPGGNPNDMEVVIPLISEQTVRGEEFNMPWRLIAEAMLTITITGIICLYLVQAAFMLQLGFRRQKPGRKGLIAAETLLLIRLRKNGLEAKKRSQTIFEYASEYPQLPELLDFAASYTRLRFSLATNQDPQVHAALVKKADILARKSRPKGFWSFIKRKLSLSALRYL